MNDHVDRIADRQRLSALLGRREDLLERQERLEAARQPLGQVLDEISSIERWAFTYLVDVMRDHHELRARVAQLAARRPDGDEVVRVTVSPIPGVGLGSVTRTYVEHGAVKALLGVWACRRCGCTDEQACQPPCSWTTPDLCSGCVDRRAPSSLAVPRGDS